ncbi:MAG: orotidine 5'-phosphate decarboxylase / HUMPS family protein [Candidatus Diapherotrites archaeon]
MGGIIAIPRSIIPACDVATIEEFEKIVRETSDVKKIGGYKIGFELGLGYGLKALVDAARKHTQKPIIYDHQKAATDIPDVADKFARVCKGAGLDAVILFPMAGPETEKAWIRACMNAGLGVIVGGEMTHKGFLESDGGFIAEGAPKRIYEIAAELGVQDFVVPGNKPEKIREYRELLESKGVKPVLYSPGLVVQGGELSKGAEAAGKQWHAIVGRGIYGAKDMRRAAEELGKEL